MTIYMLAILYRLGVVSHVRERTAVKNANCCCSWGAAVTDEWPEFECVDCERHQNAFGMADRRCKRHKAVYAQEVIHD